jgi:1,4-alpha-glucan branching enzyme
LHASDADPAGFAWIDLHNVDQSIWAFLRRDPSNPAALPLVCIFNATPVPREDYWIGVPEAGTWFKVMDTDWTGYGGSGYVPGERFVAEAEPSHGFPCRMRLTLPPLAALFLHPER